MQKGKNSQGMEKVILVLKSLLSIATLWQTLLILELQPPQILYWLSIAAITNYHTLNGLNDTDLMSYTAGDQKSEMDLTGLRTRH